MPPYREQLTKAQNYLIMTFLEISHNYPSFSWEFADDNPVKGEPLTVLVMPKYIVSEHMFDVNDPIQELGDFRCLLYHISWMRWHVIFASAHQKSRDTSIYVYRLIMGFCLGAFLIRVLDNIYALVWEASC